MIKESLIVKRISKLSTVLVLTTAMLAGNISGIAPVFNNVESVFANETISTKTIVDSGFECLVYLDSNTCIIQKWTGKASSVVVPSKISGYTVKEISIFAFKDCTSIKSVKISKGVESIAGSAFEGCKNLESVELPNSITKIEGCAFFNCKSLKSIKIPSSITEIADDVFYGCKSLKSIKIPASIKEIHFTAFSDCSGLESIIVDKENKVYDSRDNCNAIIYKKTGSLIRGCKNTKIPNSVTKISSDAFYGCIGLVNIDIPDNITCIDTHAFGNCSNLNSIKIPSSVNRIESNPFYNCNSLKNIKVDENNKVYDSRDNCNAIIETESNSLISGCKNTMIPNSVTRIGASAFAKCTGLKNIIIPAGIANIEEDAFENCSDLESIQVDKDNKVYDSRNNCNAIIETKNNLLICGCKNTKIPKDVSSIENYAFSGCTGLTSIKLPSCIENVCDDAFVYCTGLKTIDIPKNTRIDDGAFFGCNNLKFNCYRNSSAHIYAVKNGIKYVLVDDKTLNIKNGLKIKDEPTQGNYKITSVTSEGGTVEYCSCTNSKEFKLKVPDSIKISGKTFKVTSIASNAHKNNKNIAYLCIGKNVAKIGEKAFYGDKNLKSVVVKSKKLTKGSIKENAFKGIKTKVVIEAPKTNIEAYKAIFKNSGVSEQAIYKAYKE